MPAAADDDDDAAAEASARAQLEAAAVRANLAQKKCTLFLPAKRRCCSLGAKPGTAFCGAHGAGRERERVPCPLDPKHTVFADELDKHVKVCPARVHAQESQPWFREGINTLMAWRNRSTAAAPAPLPPTPRTLNAMFENLEACHRTLGESAALNAPPELALPSEAVRVLASGEAWRSGNRVAAGEAVRHSTSAKMDTQRLAIAAHMRKWGMLPQDRRDGERCYPCVEVGAGRGFLAHACALFGSRALVLVERRSYRFKADTILRGDFDDADRDVALVRVRGDAANVDLEHVFRADLPQCASERVAVCGKHLCGSATDQALIAAVRLAESASPPNAAKDARGMGRLSGVAIATCCHHACTYDEYCGMDYLDEHVFPSDVTSDAARRGLFVCLSRMASWAVDASENEHDALGLSDGASPSPAVLPEAPPDLPETPAAALRQVARTLAPARRHELGRVAKRILDEGRRRWCASAFGGGARAEVVPFVRREVSPENRLLLVTYGD